MNSMSHYVGTIKGLMEDDTFLSNLTRSDNWTYVDRSLIIEELKTFFAGLE